MLFQDFSQEFQKKCKTFSEACRRLWEHNIKYGMLYPSWLRIQHEGTTKFFDNPAEADTWRNMLP